MHLFPQETSILETKSASSQKNIIIEGYKAGTKMSNLYVSLAKLEGLKSYTESSAFGSILRRAWSCFPDGFPMLHKLGV